MGFTPRRPGGLRKYHRRRLPWHTCALQRGPPGPGLNRRKRPARMAWWLAHCDAEWCGLVHAQPPGRKQCSALSRMIPSMHAGQARFTKPDAHAQQRQNWWCPSRCLWTGLELASRCAGCGVLDARRRPIDTGWGPHMPSPPAWNMHATGLLLVSRPLLVVTRVKSSGSLSPLYRSGDRG